MMRGNLVAWLDNSEIAASWKGAREFLVKRREARRAQPFIPIQVFGLALNDDGPGSIGARAVKPAGAGNQTQN